MDQFYGYFLYSLSLLSFGGIFAILTLGLNIQWGFSGLFNIGIAGFFAIGAYTSAILTTAPSARHLGGFDLPIVVGFAAAMGLAAIFAWFVARICIRLRSDYLAISTLGIAEIFRLTFKNETDLTNGARGISYVPKPFENLPEPWNQIGMALLILGIVGVLYFVLERARVSPWGRVMSAIRENEDATRASGKDVDRLRVQAFVVGSAIMGLGGAVMAHYLKFIDPQAAEPLQATFLVWVMLIVGGSGNNKGAILGAILMWTIWSATEIVTSRLPDDMAIRSAYVRIFLIGLVLQIVLQKYATGILPERRAKSIAQD
ncbi:MAG: branched-chain amino acid ABC transporter permease [Fimbriimonadaceae bacterium]|nr:branched-chain amino acid ABC transporter permease [Alphaproteobacteria bacterium]